MTSWTSVRARPSRSNEGARSACLAALFAQGAQGIHEDGDTLVTHFPPGTDLIPIHAALSEADQDVVIETTPVADVDWSEAWKSRIGAQSLGALTITPPWLADQYKPEARIVIEPGMAFGTGEH